MLHGFSNDACRVGPAEGPELVARDGVRGLLAVGDGPPESNRSIDLQSIFVR